MQLKGVALTKLDKNKDPVQNVFEINTSILYYTIFHHDILMNTLILSIVIAL